MTRVRAGDMLRSNELFALRFSSSPLSHFGASYAKKHQKLLFIGKNRLNKKPKRSQEFYPFWAP